MPIPFETSAIGPQYLADLISGRTILGRHDDAEDGGPLATAADAHGVLPLLDAALLRTSSVSPSAPRRRMTLDAATDLVRERALREVVEALATAGIPALLLKGADLAYSVYEQPHLRPRTDTDVLVAHDDRFRAGAVLRSLGYARAPQVGGDLVMYQEQFVREDAHGASVVDLHWRVANPQRFAGVLPFDEVYRDSQPRPLLSPQARGLHPVHALLLACVHRLAHHLDAPRLIWTYDIHLLAARLSDSDWRRWVELAERRDVVAACRRGLALAEEAFHTPVPIFVTESLSTVDLHDPLYATPDVRHIARVWADVKLLPGWTARARLVYQHLFPSPEYMREVYAPASGSPVVVLYVQRLVRGSRRWLKRS